MAAGTPDRAKAIVADNGGLRKVRALFHGLFALRDLCIDPIADRAHGFFQRFERLLKALEFSHGFSLIAGYRDQIFRGANAGIERIL